VDVLPWGAVQSGIADQELRTLGKRSRKLAGAIQEQLSRLRELQELDSLLDRLEERRQAVAQELAREEAQVAAAREQLRAEEADTQALRRTIDKKELELKAKEEGIARLSVQLNSVKTNREYSAIQHEIATLRADASLLEDESLAMMERIDEGQRRQAEMRRKVRELDAALGARRGEIQARHQELQAEAKRLQAERAGVAANVAPAHRELYEHLRPKSGGKAVVAARNGACEGCFMDLTHNQINHLMGGEQLIRCNSCGRILYLVRDEEESDD
jgi:hypothetical protein